MIFILQLQVEHTLELSSTITDRAAGMSDSDSETGASPVDVLMLERATTICNRAIQNAGVILPETDKTILNWLKHRRLINVFDNGDICLARDSVRHGLKLSNAVLERSLRGREATTTLELQEDLASEGWTIVSTQKEADILSKRAFRDNPYSYFDLLVNFADALIAYEEENAFHHRQSAHYYKSIDVAIQLYPDEVVNVPPYQPTDFYHRLQQFLNGVSAVDPRVNIKEKTSRKHVSNFRFFIFSISCVHRPKNIFIYITVTDLDTLVEQLRKKHTRVREQPRKVQAAVSEPTNPGTIMTIPVISSSSEGETAEQAEQMVDPVAKTAQHFVRVRNEEHVILDDDDADDGIRDPSPEPDRGGIYNDIYFFCVKLVWYKQIKHTL